MGLGNPGPEYADTRHNAGFRLADHLAERWKLGVFRRGERARQASGVVAGRDVKLLKPQTYMNLSGRSVGALARFYKILPEEVLVVHDELDFPPGTAKLKLGGGVAGHNGLKDIAAQLGTHGFWRLRIGIGHPGNKDLVAGYVLTPPPPAERELMEAALARCMEASGLLLEGDMEAAMLKLHTKS